MRKLLIGLVVGAACAGAHAEFKDGNKLLSELNSEVYYTKGVAMGYIMGVADAVSGVTHCAPPNVTAGQINDMVKNMLENTPSIRHWTADVIINYVLKSTWPCPKGRGGQSL